MLASTSPHHRGLGVGTDQPDPSRAAPWLTTVVVAALTAMLLAACTTDDGQTGGSETAADSTTSTTTETGIGNDSTGLAVVPDLVDEIRPSIVSVRVTSNNGQRGEASGVIVRSDGVVVTNYHVVRNAAEVVVVLAEGSRAIATVEATDPVTDLAILRIDRQDLPEVELSDSYPRVGQLAVAVGNPLGFENTVTAGVISGIGRSIPTSATPGGLSLVDLIQTDAAISPGASGGALVSADGTITGINVAFIPPAVGAVSLGFAIPAPTARDVIDELLEDGTAEHAYLGVQVESLTEQLAQQFDLATDSGAAVVTVETDSPAADAGLEQGDIITSIDDEPVSDVPDLLTVLRRYDPGDTVRVSFFRNGEPTTIEIDLASRPRS